MGKFDSYYNPPDDPEYCAVCGAFNLDDCICPECPICGTQGDITCYIRECNRVKEGETGADHHGLVLNMEQLHGQAIMEERGRQEAKAEEEYFKSVDAEMECTKEEAAKLCLEEYDEEP